MKDDRIKIINTLKSVIEDLQEVVGGLEGIDEGNERIIIKNAVFKLFTAVDNLGSAEISIYNYFKRRTNNELRTGK